MMGMAEKLTLDDEIEVSRLLSEYLNVLERFPLIRDEYWKRRKIIQKYQKYVGEKLTDEE
jgi:hypothetical protein